MWLIAFRVTALGWLAVLGWGLATSLASAASASRLHCRLRVDRARRHRLRRGLAAPVARGVAAAYPDRASVGQPLQIRCALQNKRRTRSTPSARASFCRPSSSTPPRPLCFPGCCPGEVSRVPRPARPGAQPLSDAALRAFTTFPSTSTARPRATARPGSSSCCPPHLLHPDGVPVGTRYQPGGIALTSHTGESLSTSATAITSPATPSATSTSAPGRASPSPPSANTRKNITAASRSSSTPAPGARTPPHRRGLSRVRGRRQPSRGHRRCALPR